jgi:hypothetical protein
MRAGRNKRDGDPRTAFHENSGAYYGPKNMCIDVQRFFRKPGGIGEVAPGFNRLPEKAGLREIARKMPISDRWAS